MTCRHCGQKVRWRGARAGHQILVHEATRSMYCSPTSATHAELEE